jgi:hypothetical protein
MGDREGEGELGQGAADVGRQRSQLLDDLELCRVLRDRWVEAFGLQRGTAGCEVERCADSLSCA